MKILGIPLPTFGRTTPEEALSPLLADVARPLAEPNPCGTDVSFEPDFLQLRKEIDKLNGFDAERVISIAHAILRDQSKDLRVVCYLALGLARRDGLHGVAEGARAIELVVAGFWDALFPPLSRMTGRLNAIEAGIGWLRESVDGATPTAASRDALEAASRSVTNLRGLAAAWNNDRVLEVFAAFVTSLSDARAKIDSVTPPPTNGPRPVDPPINTERPVAEDGVVGAAIRLVREDPKRSLPYRLLRVYRWDPLVQDPPSTGKRTRIEPPPAPRRAYLARLHKESRWQELVVEAEESFSGHPFHFWLDLQRFTLDALDALGVDFVPAREGVLKELRLLVGRLPNLCSLSFADDTRFASPTLVSWLADLPKESPAVGDGKRGARAGKASESEPYADARKRFTGGDLNGALALLERGADDDTSDRQRFRRREYMASLCLEAGQVALARALLEELAHLIEAHGLARWEPELAMAVWTRQYACYTALAARMARGPEAERLAREIDRVFALICCVDPVRAVAMGQEVRRPP